MPSTTAWSQPQDVADVDMVFPTGVGRLMPAMSDIPREFHYGHTKWNKVQSDWFFRGLKGAEWSPKEGD